MTSRAPLVQQQQQQQMSATISFGDLEETPSWAMQPPASFQLVQDSEFPALGPAASKHSKPLTVATHKRPVAEPKPVQARQAARLSPEQLHRALVIEESAHLLQLALANPKPKRSETACNLMTRMQFMRGSNGLSFTSDLCLLPKDLNVGKCGDRHKLAAEVSVKLHAALVAQCGRDDFTVSVRFGFEDKARQHNVRATVMW
jgi:hypothetical protein